MPDGTIVIADDHRATRCVLGDLLRDEGWSVFEARDGVELLELASTHRPDAVVTDLAMPKMDGLRAARALRDRQERAEQLLIAMTGRTLTAAQEARLAHVFDRVLRKPVHPVELRRVLRLERRIG